MTRWLRSHVILAVALCRNLLWRLFERKTPATWIGRLRAEQLAPTPAGAWPLMAASGRCIGCGLCDAVVPPGVMASAWIVGACRQPSDGLWAADKARALMAAAPKIAQVCPAGVDVAAVARLMQLHADSLGSGSGQAGGPRATVTTASTTF